MPVPTNTRVEDVYPPKWLKAEHLAGKRVTITIADINIEPIPEPPSYQERRRIVVTIRGREKGPRWILSRTNAGALAKLLGTDVLAEWIGARVSIEPERLRTGKYTIAVRAAVRPAAEEDVS